MTVPGRGDRVVAAAVALGLVGAVIRLVHLLSGRSLYIDEARVALNIGMRSFGELALPLDLEQVAPVPFLWAVKASTLLLGMNEVALRLVAFVAGIALLPVFWLAARRLLTPTCSLLALALVAFSPALVRASNDAKPYALDALVGALLLWLAVRALDRPEDRTARWWVYAAATVGTLCSLPGVMNAGAALAGLGLASLHDRDWRRAGEVAAVALAVVAAAAVPYALNYYEVGSSDYMQAFWARSYLVGDPERGAANAFLIAGDFAWGVLAGKLAEGHWAAEVLLAYVLGGIAMLSLLSLVAAQKSKEWGGARSMVCLLPFAFAVALNALHYYPLRVRLELFLWPATCVLLAAGAAMGYRRMTSVAARATVCAAAALMMLLMALTVCVRRFWPYSWRELRPVANAVHRANTGTAVYVNAGAAPAWLFYTTDWDSPDEQRLSWYQQRIRAAGAAFENSASWPAGDSVALDLKWVAGRHTELVGRSTGQQFRPYEVVANEPLSDVWVREETSRLLELAEAEVTLVFSNQRRSENSLLDQLERSGAQLRESIVTPGAYAFYYRMSDSVPE